MGEPAEPVPVADQKEAGVPPEETVTMADQRAGEPLPDSYPEDVAASQDNVTVKRGSLAESVPSEDAGEQAPAGEGADATQAQQPIGATANETPTLPAGAQTAAAKAHATLEHLVTVAKAAQAEIGRYVPPDLLAAAERDVKLFVRSIL